MEDKLPQLFAHLEIEVLRQAHAEKVAEQRAHDRQRQWEAAMAAAKIAYGADARWRHFVELSEGAKTIESYRAFLETAERAAEQFDDVQRDRTGEYLREIRAHIDANDPLLVPDLLLPNIPEPTPERLQPFLQGWSAHGPER